MSTEYREYKIYFFNVMKQIFIVAALALVAVSCDSATNTTSTAPANASEVTTNSIPDDLSQFPLAYVDVDEILVESTLYKAEGLPLQQRGEAAQRDWSQKEQRFQAELTALNEKYQNGLITTANAQREQSNIEQRAQSYQLAMQQQARELDEENTVFSNRTQKFLREAIQAVNKDGRYKMILSATSLIDADTLLNISNQVRIELDRIYAAESAK